MSISFEIRSIPGDGLLLVLNKTDSNSSSEISFDNSGCLRGVWARGIERNVK